MATPVNHQVTKPWQNGPGNFTNGSGFMRPGKRPFEMHAGGYNSTPYNQSQQGWSAPAGQRQNNFYQERFQQRPRFDVGQGCRTGGYAAGINPNNGEQRYTKAMHFHQNDHTNYRRGDGAPQHSGNPEHPVQPRSNDYQRRRREEPLAKEDTRREGKRTTPPPLPPDEDQQDSDNERRSRSTRQHRSRRHSSSSGSRHRDRSRSRRRHRERSRSRHRSASRAMDVDVQVAEAQEIRTTPPPRQGGARTPPLPRPATPDLNRTATLRFDSPCKFVF